MSLLLLIAFVFFIVGIIVMFNLKPTEILDAIKTLQVNKTKPIRTKVIEVTRPKRIRGIRKIIFDTKTALLMTQKENHFTFIIIAASSLFLLGLFVAITLKNYLLVPVLSVGLAVLPFAYIILLSNRWQKALNAELETALSIITTSYMRSEDLIAAIEENVNYINPPVADVFKGFMTQTKLINSNTKRAIENLKRQINNQVFHEWCDGLIACQDDRNMKTTLVPIVSKLSDLRVIGAELDLILYEPIKEYITMVILLVGNIPLMYFLNRGWYENLMMTMVGKGVLAVCGLVILISVFGVLKWTRPVGEN